MKKHSGLFVISLIIVVSVACAPAATAPAPARPPATAATPAPAPAERAPRPEPTTVTASDLFSLRLTRDGEPVEVEKSGETWVYTADNYTLTVGFNPTTLFQFNKAQYDAYEADRGVGEASTLVLAAMRNGPTGFEFSIASTSDQPIRIIWDETAVVLQDGSSSRVIHQGVRFTDKEQSHPPTVIPPGAWVHEYARPASQIEFRDSEWEEDPLLFNFEPGETVSLFLVLEVGGERQDLYLKFVATEEYSTLTDAAK